jgi:hypothetical protein
VTFLAESLAEKKGFSRAINGENRRRQARSDDFIVPFLG